MQVAHYRQQAFQARSDYEVLKSEFDRFVSEQGKEAEVNQQQLVATRTSLQRHIDDLHRRLDAVAADDLPRTVERLKSQLEASERQWTEENHQVTLSGIRCHHCLRLGQSGDGSDTLSWSVHNASSSSCCCRPALSCPQELLLLWCCGFRLLLSFSLLHTWRSLTVATPLCQSPPSRMPLLRQLRSAAMVSKSALHEKKEEHRREVAALRAHIVGIEADAANCDRLLKTAQAEVQRLSAGLKDAQLKHHAMEARLADSAAALTVAQQGGAAVASQPTRHGEEAGACQWSLQSMGRSDAFGCGHSGIVAGCSIGSNGSRSAGSSPSPRSMVGDACV